MADIRGGYPLPPLELYHLGDVVLLQDANYNIEGDEEVGSGSARVDLRAFAIRLFKLEGYLCANFSCIRWTRTWLCSCRWPEASSMGRRGGL